MATSFGNSHSNNALTNSLYLNESIKYNFLKHKSINVEQKKEAGEPQKHGIYGNYDEKTISKIEDTECLIF